MSLSLQDSLRQTAGLFRLGQEAKASVELRLCLDKIEKNCPELVLNSTFQQILPSMLQAQEQHDWLSLADYLEYELIELV
ncbi:hypothetical protein RJP56_06495 [Shewanella baltica]|jgi:hypothetical protein|uniref:Uncharacterized protein n=1 Tax=Shewanella baltica (strain OS155 / ATCC BAA-1091) TaxID=325240 RepID=A3D6S6_SHEB5|nr:MULTISPECIES: hypothetical protein [Shewanella]MBU1390577.1 hypothetical protein [Gammaproteobacteria bacterium]ABN62439.1 conserved hypothetical protein [Shewanella baltica OS155]ACK45913.1 conserved hypothetical protein [Shewanella baltica OS223]AEG10667.1 hypothetical protein Sbal175_1390 [Shewanella baltica BA175]AEH14784.1 hypothetical protein Sbal117_3096 [Shewanella baltica OS117]